MIIPPPSMVRGQWGKMEWKEKWMSSNYLATVRNKKMIDGK
jgi:hypothetical protein